MFRLALSSLAHYRRLNLALAAGVFLASMVLVGSLVVGSSVRETLRQQGDLRLGKIRQALVGGERTFTEGWAERIDPSAAPVFQAAGTASNEDRTKRANRVQVLGVTPKFWQLAPGAVLDPGESFAAINAPLARQLGLALGDALKMRVERPGSISRDAPLSGSTESSEIHEFFNLTITHIVDGKQMGLYSLRAEQAPAHNVFVPLAELQRKLEQPGKVNLVLAAVPDADLSSRVQESWRLADLGLRVRALGQPGGHVVESERVFISPPEEAALRAILPDAKGVLTYLVNDLKHGDRSVPYSMVSAIDDSLLAQMTPGGKVGGAVVNAWLAGGEHGLDLKPGDALSITSFVFSDGRKLGEEAVEYRVASVLAMDDPNVNALWTPDFPGISDVDNCRDWEPGIPLDTDRIEDEDEDYWDDYKGTPKAFIPLSSLRSMTDPFDGHPRWKNRFGNVTGLRFIDPDFDAAALESRLRDALHFSEIGLYLRSPAAEAHNAVAKSLDFGGLFAGLSLFLIAAALILVVLLFVFGLEQRSGQIGALLSMGFTRARVRRLFMVEGGIIAFVGAVLGAIAGLAYTKLALWGLTSVWSGAVDGHRFAFAAKPLTVIAGAFGVFVTAKLAIWFASRRILGLQPRELASGAVGIQPPYSQRRPIVFLVVGLVLGVALPIAARGQQGEVAAGMFFGAGFGLLIAGLAAVALLLQRWSKNPGLADSLNGIARRNAVRRRGRSLAVAAVVAGGVFLVTAVNAFRLKDVADSSARESGTGGFRYLGTTSLPIYEDLNTEGGQQTYSLDPLAKDGISIVALRVRPEGEEASCLNLNRAQLPRLIAVDPAKFADRNAFTFAATLEKSAEPWNLLDRPAADGAVPAIADKASAMWAMGAKLGDTLVYQNGSGGELKVQLVGFLANSILQGNVLISEANFKIHFPGAGGYQMFFVDAPADAGKAIGEMTRLLEDTGFALVPTSERLAQFNAVQNTYITIFTTLGGLGVLIGTLGVGLVIGRNVLERRGELGLMQAVGFRKDHLARMVFAEHWFLLVAGLFIGIVAALIAVLPNLLQPGYGLPVKTLALLLAAIGGAGFLFCRLAARIALRGSLIESIRSE